MIIKCPHQQVLVENERTMEQGGTPEAQVQVSALSAPKPVASGIQVKVLSGKSIEANTEAILEAAKKRKGER